jgi:hypothetical protein
VVGAAGLVAGLTAGGAVIAGAATSHSSNPPHRGFGAKGEPAAVGKVATVGASSFTITTSTGTVTVDVTGSTTYFDRGVTSPSLANVTVGESVAVFGTETSGTVAATSVAIGNPGGFGGHGGPGAKGEPAAVGKVATVGASSFTITTSTGTVTVDVTGSTTYFDRGVTSPSLANVTVGESVAVFGTETSGTVAATSVAIGNPGGFGGHGGPGAPGGWGGARGSSGTSSTSGWGRPFA